MLLEGARRVGKSTIAEEFAKHIVEYGRRFAYYQTEPVASTRTEWK